MKILSNLWSFLNDFATPYKFGENNMTVTLKLNKKTGKTDVVTKNGDVVGSYARERDARRRASIKGFTVA